MDWFLEVEHKDVTSIRAAGKSSSWPGVLQERKFGEVFRQFGFFMTE